MTKHALKSESGSAPSTSRESAPGVGRRDALQRYVSEIQRHELLDGPEELSIAREIEELELEHWDALLSGPRGLPGMPSVLNTVLTAALAELASEPEAVQSLRELATAETVPARRHKDTVRLVAEQLRAIDLERTALRAADAAVRRVYGPTREAKSYLARVRKAYRAEQEAKHRFVAANLRLVTVMARRYDRGLMPLPDLIQEGNLGLMRAVERFDYRRGYRFSTYASWWIRHALSRAIADKGRLVRVPVHTLDDVQRMARARDASTAQHGRAPTAAELSERTGITEKKLSFLGEYGGGRTPVSLDAAMGSDNDTTLNDVFSLPTGSTPEDDLDTAQQTVRLERMLASLSTMEASILRFRFGLEGDEELTLNEIGDMYNLSRERIRQLQEQALRKLRGQMKHESDVAAERATSSAA